MEKVIKRKEGCSEGGEAAAAATASKHCSSVFLDVKIGLNEPFLTYFSSQASLMLVVTTCLAVVHTRGADGNASS